MKSPAGADIRQLTSVPVGVVARLMAGAETAGSVKLINISLLCAALVGAAVSWQQQGVMDTRCSALTFSSREHGQQKPPCRHVNLPTCQHARLQHVSLSLRAMGLIFAVVGQ